MPPCEACGGATAWEADAGSAVCTQCGVLADATQSVLADDPILTGHDMPFSAQGTTGIPKSTRNGWRLGGEDKDARDRRNTVRALPPLACAPSRD